MTIPKDIRDTFPYPGDKLTFKGVPEFYYPFYVDMGVKARKRLEIGKEYEIDKVEVYSSWCAIWIKDFPDERDCFNLSFFNKPI